MGEHDFPLTGFVGLSANTTFCGSGGTMSTARPELPYPCISQAKSQVETSQRVKDYISNKPPLVGEHAFPLIGFVGLSANATQQTMTKQQRHYPLNSGS